MTDLTKPVQTACGYPARVLATDVPDKEFPICAVAAITSRDWKPLLLREDGSHPNPAYSRINIPEAALIMAIDGAGLKVVPKGEG